MARTTRNVSSMQYSIHFVLLLFVFDFFSFSLFNFKHLLKWNSNSSIQNDNKTEWQNIYRTWNEATLEAAWMCYGNGKKAIYMINSMWILLILREEKWTKSGPKTRPSYICLESSCTIRPSILEFSFPLPSRKEAGGCTKIAMRIETFYVASSFVLSAIRMYPYCHHSYSRKFIRVYICPFPSNSLFVKPASYPAIQPVCGWL